MRADIPWQCAYLITRNQTFATPLPLYNGNGCVMCCCVSGSVCVLGVGVRGTCSLSCIAVIIRVALWRWSFAVATSTHRLLLQPALVLYHRAETPRANQFPLTHHAADACPGRGTYGTWYLRMMRLRRWRPTIPVGDKRGVVWGAAFPSLSPTSALVLPEAAAAVVPSR